MVPASFHDFFLAMSGAGAALIGLLFVAVSINSEQIVGPQAAPERQGVAASTLTALVTGFVISSFALIPPVNLGYVALAAASLGLGQSLLLGARLGRRAVSESAQPPRRRRYRLARAFAFTGLSLFLYGFELVLGRRVVAGSTTSDTIASLAVVLVSIYVMGLFRAWTLLGARRGGPGAWLNPLQDLDGAETAGGTGAAARAPIPVISENERHKAN